MKMTKPEMRKKRWTPRVRTSRSRGTCLSLGKKVLARVT